MTAASYHNFVIVGTQRTGSSALAERIGLHPHVACGWEWTESFRVFDKLGAMERGFAGDFSRLRDHERQHMNTCCDDATRWIGFRRLFGASDKWCFHPRYSLKLMTDRMDDHLRWFKAHPEVNVIHVIREDNVAWLRSKFVARESNSFAGEEYPEDLAVHIPRKEALARLRSKRWVDETLKELEGTNPYLRVTYEALSADIEQSSTEALQFLGAEPSLCPTSGASLNKQATRTDSEYIANYDALVEYLEYEGYLKC